MWVAAGEGPSPGLKVRAFSVSHLLTFSFSWYRSNGFIQLLSDRYVMSQV